MISSSPLPPPGWYPDPAGSPQERYWEGTRWTKNLRDRPDAPTAPPAAEPALPEHVAPMPPPGVGLPPGPVPPGMGPSPMLPGHPQAYPPGWTVDRARRTRDGMRLAGFGHRLGAGVVDGVITGLLGLAAGWPYARRAMAGMRELYRWKEQNPTVFMPPNPEQFDYATPMTLLLVVISLVAAVYRFILVGQGGATLGQRLMGVRVVPLGRGTSPHLSWGQSALRAGAWMLVRFASLMVIFPEVISYLRPLWHPGSMTYHDSIARTQVVDVRHPESRQLLELSRAREGVR